MDGAIAPARATVDAAELQAEIDGPDRALLLPLAHLVLVLPPPPEGAVSTIVIQWGSEGAIEIPTPGSILWRGALRMRLNCLDRCTETGRIEAAGFMNRSTGSPTSRRGGPGSGRGGSSHRSDRFPGGDRAELEQQPRAHPASPKSPHLLTASDAKPRVRGQHGGNGVRLKYTARAVDDSCFGSGRAGVSCTPGVVSLRAPRNPEVEGVLSRIVLNLLQVVFVLGLAPLAKGVLDRLKERVQSKRGPSIWQPYRDLWKLFAQGRGRRGGELVDLPRRRPTLSSSRRSSSRCSSPS